MNLLDDQYTGTTQLDAPTSGAQSSMNSWDNFLYTLSHPISTTIGAFKGLGVQDKYDTKTWNAKDWSDFGWTGTNDKIISVLNGSSDGVGHSGSSIDAVNPTSDPTGYDQAAWSLEQQWKMDEAERLFNSNEAQKTRDWQERMSNTAIQRQVEDIKKAGLNPWLALNGGSINGASTPSGATASASSGSSKVPHNYLYQFLASILSSASGLLKALV